MARQELTRGPDNSTAHLDEVCAGFLILIGLDPRDYGYEKGEER